MYGISLTTLYDGFSDRELLTEGNVYSFTKIGNKHWIDKNNFGDQYLIHGDIHFERMFFTISKEEARDYQISSILK